MSQEQQQEERFDALQDHAQAAGNSQISTGSCVDHQIRRGSKGPPYPKAGKFET